jgi:hypothetical protein
MTGAGKRYMAAMSDIVRAAEEVVRQSPQFQKERDKVAKAMLRAASKTIEKPKKKRSAFDPEYVAESPFKSAKVVELVRRKKKKKKRRKAQAMRLSQALIAAQQASSMPALAED